MREEVIISPILPHANSKMASDAAVNVPVASDSTSEARTAFLESLKSVGSNLDADLRSRATTLHDNASIIQKQEDELKETTNKISQDANELEKLVDYGSQALKEVGDLQNWAELMERDLLIVEETLRLAEEEDMRNGHLMAQQDKPRPKGLRRWF